MTGLDEVGERPGQLLQWTYTIAQVASGAFPLQIIGKTLLSPRCSLLQKKAIYFSNVKNTEENKSHTFDIGKVGAGVPC